MLEFIWVFLLFTLCIATYIHKSLKIIYKLSYRMNIQVRSYYFVLTYKNFNPQIFPHTYVHVIIINARKIAISDSDYNQAGEFFK